jgi:hypothetical protein
MMVSSVFEGMGPHDIFSVMLYPNNKNRRKEFQTFVSVERYLKFIDGKKLLNPPVDISKAIFETSSNQGLLEESAKILVRGWIAGDVLRFLRYMYIMGISEPSLKKARYLARQLHSTYDTDDIKTPQSDKSIANYWKEFLPVVHLWAALRSIESSLAGEGKDGVVPQNMKFQLSSKRISYFFALAESYRRFGEEKYPSRVVDPKPFLEPGKSYYIPEKYLHKPLNVEILFSPEEIRPNNQEFELWIKKTLKNYSAKN